MKIMVIQGPNINMLGHREAAIYGVMKMEDIHEHMKIAAKGHEAQGGEAVELEFFQSNFEGEIVDKIQECLGTKDGIIINPAGYSHTSVAIRDAIAAVALPTIEVHISNIFAREEFRQKSLISPVCGGTITGFGPFGYHLALVGVVNICEQIAKIRAAQTKK